MSSYNQRKKKEALRRLSQGRSRSRTIGGNEPVIRRTVHQRAHTGSDALRPEMRRMMPAQSTVSPLERSEVQGRSSSSPLFGKPALSPSAAGGLFGKGVASSSSENLFPENPPIAVKTGLFGKASPPNLDSVQEGFGGDLPPTVYPLYKKKQAPPEPVFGVSQPASVASDSTTQVKALFGKPIVQPESTSSLSAGLFGKPKPTVSAQQPVSSTKMLFGRPAEVEPADEAGIKPLAKSEGLFGKGKPGPFQRSFGGSKRTLVEMEEGVAGRQQDLSNLESFGETLQSAADSEDTRKPAVRRRGLFTKAMEGIEGKKKRRSEESDPEGRKSRRSSVTERHRTASQEEIKQITSIVCKDIPPALNLRGILVDIFQEYGEVVRVSCQPENRAAIIYYADHASASKAKRKVKYLERGSPPVSVFWASPQSKSSKSEKAKPKAPSASRSPVRSEKVRERAPVRSEIARERAPVRSEIARERASVSPSRRSFPASRVKEEQPAVTSTLSGMSSKAVQASLKALEGKIGNTAFERLEILEERDKLKRQERTLNQGSMPTLSGECEDMCPEKERYMREFQRRLSVYEVENVGAREQRVCHPAAVKEYSRSSADQELPLPSDLRLPGILAMTMDYLMNNIMDKGLGEEGHSWGEWYNFLWDRTRSIRKDITQQQLCDTTAVDLLEKCTRFHIFCAHRLCEEDAMTFDPKINSENLTKCLQSLKHLYDDLTEKGVTCRNEAEFRAYDVLLNLNQGDILRQVQNYRSEVRNSEVIRFAVHCVSAISSQNYVRFFKLVRSGTYLNSCIIHRYFTQVRNTAIEIISKAFHGKDGYPISEVKRLLAFENHEQVTIFCEAHGLNVSNSLVTLSRNSFLQPDFVINPVRSISIIEAKNESLIGEVVNGGSLPPNLRHHPSSSFDDEGRFSLTKTRHTDSGILEPQIERPQDVDDAEDHAGSVAVQLPEPSTTPVQKQLQYSLEDIEGVARDIFLEVIDEAVQQVLQSMVSRLKRMEGSTAAIAEDILAETTWAMVGEISKQTIDIAVQEDALRTEIERQETERRVAKQQLMIGELSQEIYEETLSGVLRDELWKITATEKRVFEKEQRAGQVQQLSSALTQEYLDAAVLSLVTQVSRDVYEDELRLRDEALAMIEQEVHQLQQTKYFKIWRHVFAKRLRLKDTIETFPAGPPTCNISDQLREFIQAPKMATLGSDPGSFLSVYEQQHGVAVSILEHHRQRFLSSRDLWSPYDIPALTAELPTNGQSTANHLYWKLVVSVPSSPRSEEFALFCSWLKSKLRRGYIPEKLRKISPAEDVEIETCSLYSTKINPAGTISSICTKVVSGTLPPTAGDNHSSCQIREALAGARGLVLVLETPDTHGNRQSYFCDQSRRLLRLLTGKPKHPGLPLLVYSVDTDKEPSPAWRNICLRSLNIASFKAEGYISDVTYAASTGNLWEANLAEKVLNELKWLAARCPAPPSLQCSSLSEYVDVGLTNFFSLRIRENETFRRRAKMEEESFDPVISLYKAVIEHLIACCTSGRLRRLNWPPTEFSSEANDDLPPVGWNDPSNLDDLQRLLSSLKLPWIGDAVADSWEGIREQCLLYVKSLIGSPHEKLPLISRVTWLLDRCQREFEGVCRDGYQTGGCSLSPNIIPWTSLAETCVEYVVGLLKRNLKNDDEDMPADQMVYYFQEDFDNFQAPQEWLEATRFTLDETVTCPQNIEQSYLLSVEERQLQIEREAEEERVDTEAEGGNDQWMTTTFIDLPDDTLMDKEVGISTRRLDKLLAAEKKESSRYEDYLQSLLEDTPLPAQVDPPASYSDGLARDADSLLSDKIEKLEAELNLSRQANRTMELRLETFINL